MSIPKVPCIALSAQIVEKNDDPTTSKIDSMPFIDKNRKYPMKNKKPMICIAQINMDHIFSLLASEKLDQKTHNYFTYYPKTGIIQYYLPYSEEIMDTEDDIHIEYIKEYDVNNHDTKMEKKLKQIYADYKKNHGTLYEMPDGYDDKEYYVYITKAVYGYDYLNSTLQSHPKYDDDLESKRTYFGDFEENNNVIQIGGFPYHLQADFEFDEHDHYLLFSVINGILGLNMAIEKSKLKSLDFNGILFDLSY